MGDTITVLALQLKTEADPARNMAAVTRMLADTRPQSADFIVLPEIFICPYEHEMFPLYAQSEGGEVYRFLQALAAEKKACVIGGSVPERDGDKLYNTSWIFSAKGELIGRHRKAHLFDVDIKGGQYFKESDTFAPGEGITVFDTPCGKMGVCICFDIRFPEMLSQMRQEGIVMAFAPADFNMTTGPAHWETLFKSRALDNQIFMLGCAPARNENASYIAYGHTILTDPWGRIVRQLDEKEGILEEKIDLSLVEEVRAQIPLRRS